MKTSNKTPKPADASGGPWRQGVALPDDGPWHITSVGSETLLLSETSGLRRYNPTMRQLEFVLPFGDGA